jgi:phosphoglycerate dehydrogenase-like enzyme
MKTVLVTRRVPAPGLSLLRARGFRVAVSAKDRPMSRTELLRAVKNADGLLSQLVDRIDAEVFAAAPRLRVVANYAVGHDNIDKDAARARGGRGHEHPGRFDGSHGGDGLGPPLGGGAPCARGRSRGAGGGL